MFLSVAPEVKFRPESFGGLSFIPSRAMIVELNHTGYRILEKIAIKGQSSEEEILINFSKEKQELIQQFIKDLRHSSILQYNGTVSNHSRSLQLDEGKICGL